LRVTQPDPSPAMKVVRDSKFRHVHGEALKTKYDDLRLSTKASEGNGICANSKHFAVAWESGGGGSIAVVNHEKVGRLPRDIPLISGHTGPVLDFNFNPFNEDMLCTASEDLTIKVWQLPEDGLKANMREAAAVLEGHSKKISFSIWNPVVNGIIASAAFDMTTKIWDLEEQAEAYSIETGDQVWNMKWNWTGSLLACTTKEKKMKIIDPRARTVCAEWAIHEGSKASKVEWIGSSTSAEECNKIVTTGFSSQAERQIGYWDMRMMGESAEPLNLLVLDQGTGALLPFYDDGTGLLFIAGKGDANCRFFEVTPEDPFVHWINQYGGQTPQKGFCFMPKRSCTVKKHEIMRGLQMQSNSVVPISFTVPRKSELFQEDLFPEAVAGVPAMSGDDWKSGAEPRPPVLRSMAPGAATAAGPAVQKAVVSVKDLKKQLADAEDRIKSLEAENELLKAENAKLKEGA